MEALILNRPIWVSAILFCFFSCASPDPDPDQSFSLPSSTIENRMIDSIGNLVYEDYGSYAKDPDGFLKPFDGVELDSVQKEAYIWILINMGYGFMEHGRILTSAEYYEKALRFDDTHGSLLLADRIKFIYRPLANHYTILSDYQKAERLQLKAISEAEDPLVKASFYNNLSLLYGAKQAYGKSKSAALRGLEYVQEGGHLPILLYNALSDAYISLEMPDSARVFNGKALKLGDAAPQNAIYAGAQIAALELNAKLLSLNGQHQQAVRSVNKALALEGKYYPDSRYREKAKLYNQLGWMAILERDFPSARFFLEQAKHHQAHIHTDHNVVTYTGVEVYRNLGFVHARLPHSAAGATGTDSATYYYRKAIEADFEFQQRVTSKESHLQGNRFNRALLSMVFDDLLLKNPRPDQETLLNMLWMTELTKGRLLWNDINRSASWTGDSSRLHTAILELQSLYAARDLIRDSLERQKADRKINAILAEFELQEQYFEKQGLLPDFERFRTYLQDEDAVIYAYFLRSDRDWSIFKVDQGVISLFNFYGGGLLDSVQNLKERYFSVSPHHYNQDPETYFDQATHVCQLVLPEIPKPGKAKQKLKMSLDNELFTLPFDALVSGRPDAKRRFLVEDFSLQHVHSLLTGDLYAQKTFKNTNINVLFREKYEPPYADLLFVGDEVHNLRENYPSRLFSYEELSSEKLGAVFGNGGIIHIAAHATLDSAANALLLLDQPISVDQLRYFRINSPLVMLSACNSASGSLLLSEGLESLNRAFLSKGVSGVIATHWYANDDAMLELTASFYFHLNQIGDPIEALALAKRKYLLERSQAGRNPWYWANMAYTGEDIKIDLPRRTGLTKNAPIFFAIALFLVFCLAARTVLRRRGARQINS